MYFNHSGKSHGYKICREHLFFSLGKYLFDVPERPVAVHETKTVRMEQGEDGSYKIVEAGDLQPYRQVIKTL